MVCFRGIGDRGWGHWFGGLIAQWGIYPCEHVPWDKEWVTGSLWTQAKKETKALESRVSLFTQMAAFLFSCSNSNCHSMLKASWFLVFQDEKWANPEPRRRNLLALSHSCAPVTQASCQPINTLMTYSDRLAGFAGNRGPGEVWSEVLIIPHTSGAHVTLSPQRGWGISLLGWWNGMKNC